MNIQNVGKSCITLFIEGDELADRGVAPDSLNVEQAAEFLKTALYRLGRPLWDSAVIEMFPGRDSVLIFARRRGGAPAFFAFDDIEPVIIAADCLEADIPSRLTYIDGAYVLTVHPWEGEPVPAALYEFGTEIKVTERYELHLLEHGEEIIGDYAVSVIKEFF